MRVELGNTNTKNINPVSSQFIVSAMVKILGFFTDYLIWKLYVSTMLNQREYVTNYCM